MLVFLLIKPLKNHLIDAFGGFKEILSSLVKFINFTNLTSLKINYMSTHLFFGGKKIRNAIVTIALIAVLGGALVAPTAAHAISLGELIELFIALDIIPADKAEQARSIVSNEQATPSAACPYTWTRSLTLGSTGQDVEKLQVFLNGAEATKLADTGAGSPGNETSYFGRITANGVSQDACESRKYCEHR